MCQIHLTVDDTATLCCVQYVSISAVGALLVFQLSQWEIVRVYQLVFPGKLHDVSTVCPRLCSFYGATYTLPVYTVSSAFCLKCISELLLLNSLMVGCTKLHHIALFPESSENLYNESMPATEDYIHMSYFVYYMWMVSLFDFNGRKRLICTVMFAVRNICFSPKLVQNIFQVAI